MIETYQLDNGITVICDPLPFFQSFAMGFWIKSGSINETQKNNGYSHFVEHMLFKGTTKRSYLDISQQIDSVGGYINAFTEKEYTCVQVQLMSHHIELGINLLADMVQNSVFAQQEIEKEKQVIIEEIHMKNDNPDECIYDLFLKHLWQSNPLSYSILGELNVIEKASQSTLTDFYKSFYSPNNLLVSLSGNFDCNKVKKQLNKLESQKQNKTKQTIVKAEVFLKQSYSIKNLEQVYFIWGFPSFNRFDKRRFGMHIIQHILSGGSSSRLFVEIREKRGLAYSIDSANLSYETNGVFMIYSSSTLEHYPKILEVIQAECNKLVSQGINEMELNKAKEQIKGSLTFESEILESRMYRQAKYQLNYNQAINYPKLYQQIESVSLEEVNELLVQIMQPKQTSFYSLGPEKHKDYKILN